VKEEGPTPYSHLGGITGATFLSRQKQGGGEHPGKTILGEGRWGTTKGDAAR